MQLLRRRRWPLFAMRAPRLSGPCTRLLFSYAASKAFASTGGAVAGVDVRQTADTEHIYPDIDPRFYYGELRLSRLNKMYLFPEHCVAGKCLVGISTAPFF